MDVPFQLNCKTVEPPGIFLTRAVNACILFLPLLHGKAVRTFKGISGPDRHLQDRPVLRRGGDPALHPRGTAPRDRQGAGCPRSARVFPSRAPVALGGRAVSQAHQPIFTYSHEIDLALCAALLRHGFAPCGQIGPATKWARARFRNRLSAAGLDPARHTCPIGDKPLGKPPGAIANGTLAALLRERTPA